MADKLHIDYETRSVIDLRKVGSWNYSKHPSTDVTCISWGINDEPIKGIWGAPTLNNTPYPRDIIDAWADPNVEIWAHNAGFERHATLNVLCDRYGWPAVSPERWRCSMALCGRWGLPQGLDAAARALRLPIEKDKAGYKLMLRMCKPRRTKSTKTEWVDDQKSLERLSQYCNVDVDVERMITKKLPAMDPEELAIWQWTENLNDYGILTDQDLIQKILSVIAVLDERDLAAFGDLTGGAVESPRQRDALLAWLSDAAGCKLDDLRSATIRDALTDADLSFEARAALQSRQNLSKSSLSKFLAMVRRADVDDHRVRGHLRYAGAHTLRWSGQGVQTQNLPSRSDVSKAEVKRSVDIFKTGDVDYCEMVLSNTREVASMATRSAFCAPPGKVFVAVDFASIEARGVLWLAGAEQLEILRSGRNLYIEMAKRIYGRDVDKHADPIEYSLGKQAILGLGYGMGAPKFVATCHGYDIPIELDLAQNIVDDYRTWIHTVPALWRDLEYAFTYALHYGGPTYCADGKIKVEYAQQTLRCTLPSGRKMIYWYPRMRDSETSWGEVRPQLHFFKQGKFTYTYGGKLVENVTQALCRDLLRDAALRVWRERPEYQAVLTVHDELVFEVDEDKADLDDIIELMCVLPAWADGIPLGAEGWIGKRFKK